MLDNFKQSLTSSIKFIISITSIKYKLSYMPEFNSLRFADPILKSFNVFKNIFLNSKIKNRNLLYKVSYLTHKLRSFNSL